jgi:hypothetical protein
MLLLAGARSGAINPFACCRLFARSAFERLEVRNHVANLAGVEPKYRHGRMARADSLRQRFGQILDRVSPVQRAEGRRNCQRAIAQFVDGVAACTIRLHEGEAPLGARRHLRHCRAGQKHAYGANETRIED